MTISVRNNYQFCPNCANPLQRRLIEEKRRPFCDKCGFVFWNNPKPAVSIILEKEGNVLLLKRREEPFKDYWVLPGGYVGYNEEPTVTIRREVNEETGLDVTVGKIVSVYLVDDDPRGNSIDIVYAGTISGGTLKLREHSKGTFFSPKDLPHLIAYKHREVINSWFKNK